jgi:hypothetical protein
MPVNIREFKDYLVIFVGLVLLMFGGIMFITNIQANFTQSLIFLFIGIFGFILIAYVFANEK